jgi:hypothetical protein
LFKPCADIIRFRSDFDDPADCELHPQKVIGVLSNDSVKPSFEPVIGLLLVPGSFSSCEESFEKSVVLSNIIVILSGETHFDDLEQLNSCTYVEESVVHVTPNKRLISVRFSSLFEHFTDVLRKGHVKQFFFFIYSNT